MEEEFPTNPKGEKSHCKYSPWNEILEAFWYCKHPRNMADSCYWHNMEEECPFLILDKIKELIVVDEVS